MTDNELAEPWRRVRDPRPIPSTAGRGVLAATLTSLDDNELAILIRDQLSPLSSDAGYKRQWQTFWSVLGVDAGLRERVGRILDDFLDRAENALNDDIIVDHQQRKRAKNFIEKCQHALDRIEKWEDEPLAWAGAAATNFNAPARAVIEQLVSAIAQHRRDQVDETLLATLETVGLDPDRVTRRRRG